MRKAKSCNHLLDAHHANGTAIRMEIATNSKKFFEINNVMLLTFAPRTRLIPISFERCIVVKAVRPNNPRHAKIMASADAIENKEEVLCSETYNLLYASSKK